MSANTSTVIGQARVAVAIAALFALAVLLGGCSSGADAEASVAGAPVGEVDGGGDDAGDGTDAGQAPTANRSVIVTGSMYMTVEDPLAAADKATSIVNGAGGRVDARDETAPDEWSGGSATLTLRIPADRLDAVVVDLRALGTVDQLATKASDVTNQVTDLDAHISTLRASTQRIEALLVEAKDITDIIKLEDELASRQAELESLEAQQRGLDDQVSLSTIELSLTTVPVVVADDAPATFFDGLSAGWNGLVGFVSVGLVVLGALLPWLIAGAVIALVVVAVVRRRRSRAALMNAAPIQARVADTPVADAPVADAPVADATSAP